MTDRGAMSLVLTAPWSSSVLSAARNRQILEVCCGVIITATVRLERCLHGRLRDGYPAGARDIEVRVLHLTPDDALDQLLSAVCAGIRRADPMCRKVVYAAHVDDGAEPSSEVASIKAAVVAGFRHVVDIELEGHDVALMVDEPEWVTHADDTLDKVPGS